MEEGRKIVRAKCLAEAFRGRSDTLAYSFSHGVLLDDKHRVAMEFGRKLLCCVLSNYPKCASPTDRVVYEREEFSLQTLCVPWGVAIGFFVDESEVAISEALPWLIAEKESRR